LSALSIGRRGATALGIAFALASCARAASGDEAAAPGEIPRMDPARCVGQPEIAPLQPLQILTSRGPVRLKVELADTPRERAYGLMCRTSLAPDHGMLFDFGAPLEDAAFWMRNTLIGLDIVYIAPDGRVLSVARNARPLDESPIPAGGEVRAVLEIGAGRAAELGVAPGDKVVSGIFGR
jgi:uncharacterized membrane protein (UPF0127 family)